MKKLMHVGAAPDNTESPIIPTAVEAALMNLVDPSTLALVSPAKVKRFVNILHRAKTEPEQALVLVILRATTASSDTKLARSCAGAFEASGGLKVSKQWLEAAVTWNYSDLLVLLLDVLKRVPLQLTSITEARINEPIVKLRKGAREEKVKRAAQDLLKHWRSKFTEKPAPPPATPVAAPAPPATTEITAKPTSPRASATADASSTQNVAASTSISSTSTTATSSPPKVSKLVGKMIKRRPIKRLERLPFGGGSSVSKSSSSELIGNLMQRKSDKEAKEAAAAASEATSPREGSSGGNSDAHNATSTVAGSSSPPSLTETTATAASDSIPMELPTIQSFKAAASAPSKSSKRIRWADQNGEELVKIKLIESWRDMVQYTPHDENAFRDAKLREHADERNAMKSHREPVRSSFKLVLAHNWRTPAFVQLPDALAARRRPLQTDEMHVQSSRTRREMEYLVLDGEVPPPTPKEWVRAPNDIPRGPPLEIPLSDVAEPAAASAAAPGGSMPPPPGPGHYEYETVEDRALREALGPLSKATIAVLMDNEDALPQVYDEAQRNGNHIPDGRVLEIVDYHRRARGAPPLHMDPGFGNFNKYGGGPPAPQQQQQQQHSRYGGGFDAPPMNAPGMPPYGVGPPNAFGKKRKAPGQGPAAFNDAPPAKRTAKRGTVPCLFFNTPRGCKNGATCTFLHEVSMGSLGNPGAVGSVYGPPMHDMGGPPPPRHQFRGGR